MLNIITTFSTYTNACNAQFIAGCNKTFAA
jgi:hypothetical protein